MKELVREEFDPIHLNPGDILRATLYDKTTGKRIKNVDFKAETPTEIDTIVGFEGEKMFGLKRFIGAVFGEAE